MFIQSPPMESFWLWLVLVQLSPLSGESQDFLATDTVLQMELIDDLNGLPAKHMLWIWQDSKGLMWFGSDEGLIKGSGDDFTFYQSPGKHGREAVYFQEDRFGRIWFHNHHGEVFYLDGEVVHPFSPSALENSGKSRLFEILGDSVLIPNKNGLWIFSIQSGIGRELFKLDTGTFFRTLHFGDSVLWMEGNQHWLVHKENTRFSKANWFAEEHLQQNQNTKSLWHQYHSLTYGKAGIISFDREKNQILIGKKGNLRKIDLQFEYSHVPYSAFTIYAISEEVLAIPNNWGLSFFDITNNRGLGRVLHGKVFNTVFWDREGCFWASGQLMGLCKVQNLGVSAIDPSPEGWDVDYFEYLEYVPGKGLFALNNHSHILQFDTMGSLQKLFVPTPITRPRFLRYANGIFSLGNDHDRFVNLDLKKVSLPFSRPPPRKNSPIILKSPEAEWEHSLVHSSNQCWIYIDGQKQLFIRAKEGQDLWQSTWFPNLHSSGLLKAQPDKPQTWLICQESGGPLKVIGAMVDDLEKAWTIISQEGTWVLKGGELVPIKSPDGAEILGHKISNSPDGLHWICTQAQGIFGLKDGRLLHSIVPSTILPQCTIYGARSLGDRVWLATHKGLFTFQLSTMEGYWMGRGNQLKTNLLNDIYPTPTKVYLATGSGLIIIPNGNFEYPSQEPLMGWESFSVNGELQSRTSKKVFGPGSKNVEIKIASSLTRHPENHIIYYLLKGFNKEWQPLMLSNKRLSFPHLGPGNYELWLKGGYGENIGQPKEILTFRIKAKFYQTAWFKVLLFILSIALIFWIARYLINRQKNRLEEADEKRVLEHDLNMSRLAAVRSQMNPHFMFNALNSIQHFILSKDIEQANSFLGKFSELMRMTLDMSKRDWVDLEEEVQMLTLYMELEALRFSESLDFRISVDEGLLWNEIQIPSMLIQPYVENSVKHGLLHKKEKGRLRIGISQIAKARLMVSVEDNGVGRARSMEINQRRRKKHESFATGAMENRLKILKNQWGSDIGVETVDKMDEEGPKGTLVKITVPAKED